MRLLRVGKGLDIVAIAINMSLDGAGAAAGRMRAATVKSTESCPSWRRPLAPWWHEIANCASAEVVVRMIDSRGLAPALDWYGLRLRISLIKYAERTRDAVPRCGVLRLATISL